MLLQSIENLHNLNQIKKLTENLSIDKTIEYFNSIIYKNLYDYAVRIGLENYIELLNFLDAIELNVYNLRIKRLNISINQINEFIDEKYIEKIENNLDCFEQIRENIFETFLWEKGYDDLNNSSDFKSLILSNNYLENFKSKYYLTNKGYLLINDLIRLYWELSNNIDALKNEILIDKLLDDKESLVYTNYNYKNYKIQSNKVLSKELFEILIDCTDNELEDDSRKYNEVYFSFTNGYKKLKVKYIHSSRKTLNSSSEISLRIEQISDKLVFSEIKNIVFIRWLTYRHKSPKETITSWLKTYGYQDVNMGIIENYSIGNLMIAPLEIQIDTILSSEDLIKIFKSHGIKNYSTLNKEKLVQMYIDNYSKFDINQVLGDTRVYILSKKGIDLCENFYRYLPKSLRWHQEYSVFFERIEWDYKKEIVYLEKYMRMLNEQNIS